MLDVHEPKRPLQSARDFARHIVTVTLGLVLALGLEKTVEWRQHVQLRKEADANIASELRDNKAECDRTLKEVPRERRVLLDLRKLLDARKAGTKIGKTDLSLSFWTGSPRDASWQTANATGALGYMAYAHVKDYSAAYTLQADLVRLQQELLSSILRMFAANDLVDDLDHGGSIDAMTDDQVAATRAAVQDVLMHLLALEQIGAELEKQYAVALKLPAEPEKPLASK